MFLHTIFKTFALLFIANLLCAPIPHHTDSLANELNEATRKAVADANDDEDNISGSECDLFEIFDIDKSTTYTPRISPAEELLESDKKSLASAKSTVAWMQTSAQKCRKTLKTKAAKDTLAAIVTDCRMDDLSKIEHALTRWEQKIPKKYPEGAVDYSIHEWMETAHSQALKELEQHLSSGVLLGNVYEPHDVTALCNYVRDISCIYWSSHEDSLYYGWLRDIAAKYYDSKINKNDVKACFKVVEVVARFANKSSTTADDLDSILSALMLQ